VSDTGEGGTPYPLHVNTVRITGPEQVEVDNEGRTVGICRDVYLLDLWSNGTVTWRKPE